MPLDEDKGRGPSYLKAGFGSGLGSAHGAEDSLLPLGRAKLDLGRGEGGEVGHFIIIIRLITESQRANKEWGSVVLEAAEAKRKGDRGRCGVMLR